MGNSNSGRWGGKPKCERCPSLDIRSLSRKNLLTPSQTFLWKWSNDCEVIAKSHINALELRYATNIKPMQSYWFSIVQTDCNYGGTRSWLICPLCEKRYAKLYLRNTHFACRNCQNLRYNSQALDPLARHQWAYSKLQTRLSDHELRPKGMHRRTYERLIHRLIEIDVQVSESFAFMARQFMNNLTAKRKE